MLSGDFPSGLPVSSLLWNEKYAWRPPRPRRLYVAVGDPVLQDRVYRALTGVADEILNVASLARLDRIAEVSKERAVIVLGSRSQAGEVTADELEAFRLRHPLVHLVLCLARGDPVRARAHVMIRAGVDCLVWLDATERDVELRREVATRFDHALPPAVQAVFHYQNWSRAAAMESGVARNAYRPVYAGTLPRSAAPNALSVSDFLFIDRKTAYRDAKSLGWRDVQQLIDTGRLLHVGAELEGPFAPVMFLVKSLCFKSPGALHQFLMRHARMTPHALLDAGPLLVALKLWVRRGMVGP